MWRWETINIGKDNREIGKTREGERNKKTAATDRERNENEGEKWEWEKEKERSKES